MLPFYETKTQDLQGSCHVPHKFPLHLHTHLEIIFVTKGSLTMNIQGQDWILAKGDCAFVFPNILHAFVDTTDDCEMIMLLLSPSLVDEYFDTLLHHMPSNPIIPKKTMHSDIYFAIHSLLREANQKETAHKQVARALTQLLLAHALTLIPLTKRQVRAQTNLTSELIAYLYAHYQEPLSLDMVSTTFGVSQYTVSRIFTHHLQISFTQYLNALRVEHAKQLLKRNQHSISHISIEAGFTTLRTFNRVFQAQCGISPKEYRANALTV